MTSGLSYVRASLVMLLALVFVAGCDQAPQEKSGSAPPAPKMSVDTSAPPEPPVADAEPPAGAKAKRAPEERSAERKKANDDAESEVTATRSLQPGGDAKPKWDVVPVFYGTDRNRVANEKRAVYGPGRAKRLELGQALVTVPKTHQVPQVERPWVYKLPFTEIVVYREKEDPAKHFTLKDVKSMNKADFLALVRARLEKSKHYENHAVVFIHGFSVTFDNALFRTAQIAYDLKFDGAPFLYSWPSNGKVSPQDYSNDRESTGQAEPYLKEFLQIVSKESGAKTVSVIAHSMGNQLLLRVLRDLKQSAPDKVAINEIILAAPDVDRDTFEFLAREIKGLAKGMTLLAASNDRALAVSKSFWGGAIRAGDVPLDKGPLVLDGIDTIDVTSVNTEVFSLNHSGYAEKPRILKDIEQLIRTGLRPPKSRMPELVRKTTATGPYWSYP